MEDLLKKLNQEKIARYQEHLEKLDLSESTIKRRLSTLRKFYGWAEKEGYLEKELPAKAELHSRDAWTQRLHLRGVKKALHQRLPTPPTIPYITNAYETYSSISITKYLHYAILIIFCVGLGMGVYYQLTGPKAELAEAYPSALTPPKHYLSFQGRLTDSSNNPITSTTNFVFKLYDAPGTGSPPAGGIELWSSGDCSINPDTDGIFSVLLGSDCGSEIDATVFSGNDEVWLQITVGTGGGAQTLSPRIQVATVGYALNAETLQGYPPGTGTSMVPYIDSTGKIIIAAASPTIESTSGTFGIKGQAISFTTAAGSNGNITIAPNGIGTLNINVGGTGPGSQVRITDANMVSGNLVSVYAGTGATGFDLLNLSSGSIETTKFSVDESGNTYVAGNLGVGTTNPNYKLDVQGGDFNVSGNLYTGGTQRLSSGGALSNITGYSQASGNFAFSGGGDFSLASSGLDVTTGGALSNITTLSMNNQLTNSYANSAAINLTGSGAGITFGSTGPFQIITGGSSDLALMPGGNVGIGTTGPNYKLDVNGNVNIGGTATIGSVPLVSDNSQVLTVDSGIVKYIDTSAWDKDSGDDFGAWFLAGDSGSAQSIGSGNTATIAGGIGIGTTSSATDTLTINVDEAYGFAWTGLQTWSQTATFNDSIDLNNILDLDVSDASNYAANIAQTGNGGGLYVSNTGSGISFRVDDQASDTSPFVVDQYGNVGIGTTGPTQKLDIAGDILVGSDNTDGDDFIYFDTGTSESLSWDDDPGEFDLSDDLDIDGRLVVGSSSISDSATLYSYSNTTETSGSHTSGTFVQRANPSSDGTLTSTGIYAHSQWLSTNSGSEIRGIQSEARVTASTTGLSATKAISAWTGVNNSYTPSISSMYTIHSQGPAINDATVTSAYSGYFGIPSVNNGSLTSGYGIRILDGSVGASGTYTNAYGLYIDDIAAATNNYSLYLKGSSGNSSNGIWFTTDTNLYRSAANTLRTNDSLIVDGNVGIGTTGPNYKLDVAGTGRFTGALQLDTVASVGDNNAVLTTDSGVVKYIDTSGWDKSSADDFGAWFLAGDSGAQSIGAGDTATIAGGIGIGTTSSATDTLTIHVDEAYGFNWTGNQTWAGTSTFNGTGTFNSTLDANSTVTLGDGGDQVSITDDNWAISSAGAVSGITTLSMSNQLTNSYANTAAINLSGNGAGITFGSTGPFQIISGGSSDLALMPGGNVGIGTTAPGYKLDVNGNVNIGGTATIGSLPSVSDNNMVLTSDSGVVKYVDTSNWDKNTADDFGAWWLAGDSGAQSIGAGDTATIAGGIGIGTTASATDTLTIIVDQSYGFAWTGNQTWAGTSTFNGTGTFNSTLDANGVVTLGDNGENVTIDSDVWDITGAGAISGITGYSQTSGNFAFSGGGDFSLASSGLDVTTGGALSGVTTLGMSGILTNSSATTNALNLTGNGAGITFGSTGPFQIISGGSSDLALMPGGNVGIGTTGPSSKLHVEGQCVTGDSELITEDGRVLRVDEVKGGEKILSLDEETSKLVPSRILALLDMGWKETFELTTEDGQKIITTSNHPYLTKKGWEKVVYLNEGEEIAVRKEKSLSLTKEIEKNHQSNNPDNHPGPGISQNLKPNTFIHHLFASQKQERKNNDNDCRNNSCQIVSKLKIFRRHGLPFSTTFNEKNKQALAENSPTIIRPIKDDANSWGGKKNGLTIETPNQPAATVTKKSANLSLWLATRENFIKTNYIINQLSNVKQLAIDTLDNDRLKQNENHDSSEIEWVKIALIKPAGVKHVWDLSIENTHNFVANGIIAHNTYLSDNVGIGTTNPGAKLEVAGQVKITGGSPGTNKVLTSDSVGLATWENITTIGIGGSGAINYLPKFTGNTTLGLSQLFDDGTNVGIGKTNPGYKLDVAGNVYVGGTLQTTGAITAPTSSNTINSLVINSGALSGITTLSMNNQLTNSYANTAAINLTGNASGITFGGTGVNQIITGGTNNLALMPGGNVGIGTTGPGYKVDINGGNAETSTDIFHISAVTGAQTRDFLITNTGNGAGGNWQMGASSNSRYILKGYSIDLYPYNNGDVRTIVGTGNFYVNTSQLYVQGSSGNVGIGTTSPGAPLHVIGDLYVSDGLSLYENAVSDGTVEAIKFCTGDDETNCVTDFGSLGGGLWEDGTYGVYEDDKAVIVGADEDFTHGIAEGVGDLRVASDMEVLGNAYFGGASNYLTISSGGDLSLYGTADTIDVSNVTGDKLIISGGNVGIGTTGPTSLLSVGTSSQFQVNTSGDIIKLKNLTYSWPSSQVSGGFLRDTNGSGTLEWTTTVPATSVSFTNITSGTNTQAAMVVGAGASLNYTSTGTINASSLQTATWGAPLGIGSTSPNTGAFTTLTSSGNSTLGTGADTTNTLGAGASSINTIGSTTTPGTLTLHGATTLDNTLTVSGSNLTSLGGNLTVTGTAWTAIPTISGLVTMTSGFDSNAASTVTNLTIDGTSGTALNISNTGITTDINLQYGETIDNDVDGTILLTATTTKTSGNLYVGTSGTGTITSGLITASGLATTGYTATAGEIRADVFRDGNSNYYIQPADTTIAGVFAGNVGIGTTAPGSTLSLGDTSGSQKLRIWESGADYIGIGVHSYLMAFNLASTDNRFGFFSDESLGTELMTIKGTGNVGIGTTNPSSLLELASTAPTFRMTDTTGSAKSLLITVDGNLAQFEEAGGAANDLFVLDLANGRVGIGTTAPGAKLDIAGSDSLISNSAGDITIDAASNYISFAGDNLTNILNLYVSGNVGIGTTAPSAALQVAGNIFPNADDQYDLGSNTLRWRDLYLGPQTLHIGSSTSDEGTISYNTSVNDFLFDSDGDIGFQVTGGNVGIGTTAPSVQLHLTGDLRVGGNDILDAGGSTAITFDGSQNTALAGNLTMQDDKWIGIGSSSERIVFDTDGDIGFMGANVGIGTVSPNALLEVSDAAGATDKEIARFINTADTSGAYISIVGDSAGADKAVQLAADGNGALKIATGEATPGTYGTTDFIIMADGNVGIGTAEPTHPLDVNGNIRTASDLYVGGNDIYNEGTNNLRIRSVNDQGIVLSSESHVYVLLDTDESATSTFYVRDGSGSNMFYANELGRVYVADFPTGGSYALCWDNSGASLIYDCSGGPLADIAEYYGSPIDSNPGDILSMDYSQPLMFKKSDKAYDQDIIGIISTNPTGPLGDVMGDDIPQENNPQPMALTGRVPVKVNLENGPIEIGDPLTSSSQPGVAMKATKAGRIIGRALERYDGSFQISPEVQKTEQILLEEKTQPLEEEIEELETEFKEIKNSEDEMDQKRKLRILELLSEARKNLEEAEEKATITPPAPGIGKILVFTNLSWYDPDVYLTDTGTLAITGDENVGFSLTKDGETYNRIGAFSETKIANLEVGSLSTQKLMLDNLDVGTKLTEIETINNDQTSQINLLNTKYENLGSEFSTASFGVGTTAPASGSGKLIDSSSGAYLSESGVWVNTSDANLKENFIELDKEEVLEKIANLPVTRWNYKTDDESVTHIGPTAQDFYAAFQAGENDTTISSLDPAGIALVGIQALNEKLDNLAANGAGQSLDETGNLTFEEVVLEDGSKEFVLKDTTGNILTTITELGEAELRGIKLFSSLIINKTNNLTDQLAHKVIELKDATGQTIAAIDETGNILGQKFLAEEKVVTPLIETQEIETERISLSEIDTKPGEDVVISLQESPESGFGQLIVKGKEDKEVFSLDAEGNATFGGIIKAEEVHAKKIIADEIIGLEGKFGDLLAASVSAQQIQGLEERLAQLEAQPSPSPTPSPTPTSTPEPTPEPEEEPPATQSGEIDPMADIELDPEIEALVNEILGTSLESTPQAQLTDVYGENLDIVNNLTVLGITSLADTSIAGSLNVGGTMTLADDSINTLGGTLYLQNLGLGGIDILAGKVTIDEQGNAVFEGDVTIKGRLALSEIEPLPDQDIVIDLTPEDEGEASGESRFGKLLIKGIDDEIVASIDASGSAFFASLGIEADYSATQSGAIIAAADNWLENGYYNAAIETNATAGIGILPAGETEIQIYNPNITEQSLVYLVPTSSTKNKVLYVKAKQAHQEAVINDYGYEITPEEKGWFKVTIDTALSQKIEFNWWIVGGQSQSIPETTGGSQ